MYGYNVDQGLNTALKRAGTSVGEVTGPVTNTIGQQIEQRPWLILGAALVAGFVLGSIGGDSDTDDREQLWRNEERARAYRGVEPGRAPQPHVTYYNAPDNHTTHPPATSGGYSAPAVAAQASYQAADVPTQPEPPRFAPRPQPTQPSAISSTISTQVDKLTATAVPTIRNLLRDTLRDNVPALRDHVDALDRRDGRTPPAPKPAPATTLRDVDTYK